jgi:hypothetical protein
MLLLCGCLDENAPRPTLSIEPLLPPAFDAFRVRLGIKAVEVIVTEGTGQARIVFQQRYSLGEALEIPVTLQGESLQVSLKYTNSAGESLYRGSAPVVRIGPTQVHVLYTGPGSAAFALALAPIDPVIPWGDSIRLAALAVDQRGDSVPDIQLLWQTDDPTVIVSPMGQITAPNRVGEVIVYAQLPSGLTAFTRVIFAPGHLAVLPDSLEVLPGAPIVFRLFGSASAPSVWAVNGMVGGDTTVGTVASDIGSYTAPSQIPTPSTVSVCAAIQADTACAKVTIAAVPTSGGDVLAFGDTYLFGNSAMGQPGNQLLARHLVDYSAPGPRVTGRSILWDRSRAAACRISGTCSDTALRNLEKELVAAGYSITRLDTLPFPRFVPAGVKVVFEWTPGRPYNETETNALKRFSREGGRIVLVTDDTLSLAQGSFLALFSATDLLFHMGTSMTVSPVDIACGSPGDETGAAVRSHQVTAGVTALRVFCGMGLSLGGNGYALIQDQSYALASAAKVDPTPVTRFGCSCGANSSAGTRSSCRCHDN